MPKKAACQDTARKRWGKKVQAWSSYVLKHLKKEHKDARRVFVVSSAGPNTLLFMFDRDLDETQPIYRHPLFS